MTRVTRSETDRREPFPGISEAEQAYYDEQFAKIANEREAPDYDSRSEEGFVDRRTGTDRRRA